MVRSLLDRWPKTAQLPTAANCEICFMIRTDVLRSFVVSIAVSCIFSCLSAYLTKICSVEASVPVVMSCSPYLLHFGGFIALVTLGTDRADTATLAITCAFFTLDTRTYKCNEMSLRLCTA